MRNSYLLSGFLALFAVTAPSYAATVQGLPETQMASDYKYRDSWSFRIAPHIWIASLSGQANIKGSRANFSTAFSDIRHDLDFSFGAGMEASKGLWTFAIDPDYVKVTQQLIVNNLATHSTYESTMTDAGAFYRLYPSVNTLDFYPISAELFGGARIVTLHTTFQYITSPLPSPSDTSNLIVPLLGLRVKYDFNPCWHAWFTGDFGGFQVNHVSSTWSGTLGVSYSFTKHFDGTFAYKGFGINYSIQAVSINTMLQGPEFGFAYTW